MQNLFLLMGVMAIMFMPYMNCAPVHELGSASSSTFNSEAVLAGLQTKSLAIMASKCASCHNSTTANNNLKTVSDVSILISAGYIVSGSPQTSPLYLKLIDGHTTANPGVTNDDIGVIRDWISALGGNFNTIIGGVAGAPGSVTATPGKFADVEAILKASCVNCHNGQQKPNLSLAYAQLLTETTPAGLPIISPAVPSDSRLYLAVANGSMPQGRSPLSATQIETIRSWIAAGAPNN